MKIKGTPSSRLNSACIYNKTAEAIELVSQHKAVITKDIESALSIFNPLDGGIQFICKNKNAELARLLLNAFGQLVIGRFVHKCVLMGSAEILMLIFSEYPHLVSGFVFSYEFCFASYWDLAMANMFIDSFSLFPDFDLRWYCEIVFDIACDQGNTEAVKLLISRCSSYLTFPKGFRFEPNRVIKHVEVVNVLRHTYGQQLASQFPQLVAV